MSGLFEEFDIEEEFTEQDEINNRARGFATSIAILNRNLISANDIDSIYVTGGADPIIETAQKVLMDNWLRELKDRLFRATQLMESPIENYFLHSFIVACTGYQLPVVIVDEINQKEIEFFLPNEKTSRASVIKVTPQKKFENFRLDFFIEYNSKKIAVECDGREYHVQKSAMGRDRIKDRKLQLQDIQVFRYMGGELYHSPMESAKEILTHLTSQGYAWN